MGKSSWPEVEQMWDLREESVLRPLGMPGTAFPEVII